LEFYVPEERGRRRPPAVAVRCPSQPSASVVPGRREQRELAAAGAGAAAASAAVHLVGEGGGRHHPHPHPHPGGGAGHAVVVHPGRRDAAQEAVVETGPGGGGVVGERARGRVVEVADLRRSVVVVRGAGAHGGEGRVGVGGGRAVGRREEGDGPRGEEVLGGGVGGGAGAGGVAAPSPAAAEPLHALEVEAVLLEVGRDVLAREAVDAHELHYGLGHGVLDAELRHGVDEALVQLRRPHEARALERPRRLVAAPAPAAAGSRGRRRAAAVDVGDGARPAGAVRRDVEGHGEIGRDERLRERHQLVRPRELLLLLLAAREPAGLLLLPHGRGFFPCLSPGGGGQSNSCS
jgi:hypothetical protein